MIVKPDTPDVVEKIRRFAAKPGYKQLVMRPGTYSWKCATRIEWNAGLEIIANGVFIENRLAWEPLLSADVRASFLSVKGLEICGSGAVISSNAQGPKSDLDIRLDGLEGVLCGPLLHAPGEAVIRSTISNCDMHHDNKSIGVYLPNQVDKAVIRDCTFSLCKGAAIQVGSSGLTRFDQQHLLFDNVHVDGVAADDHGYARGILAYGHHVTIRDSLFENIEALEHLTGGMGTYTKAGMLKLIGNTYLDCNATVKGSADPNSREQQEAMATHYLVSQNILRDTRGGDRSDGGIALYAQGGQCSENYIDGHNIGIRVEAEMQPLEFSYPIDIHGNVIMKRRHSAYYVRKPPRYLYVEGRHIEKEGIVG